MWGKVVGAAKLTCRCLFFFQAEDGIRDLTVTGVQTCALPISAGPPAPARPPRTPAASCRRCAARAPAPNEWRRRHRPARPAVQYRSCVLSQGRSEEHTSELQSQSNLVCRLLLEKKKRSPT